MEKVLIVSGTEKSQQLLTELFAAAPRPALTLAASGAAARRLLLETDFDLVLVNTPLPDEYGHEFAVLAARGRAGVILITRAENEDELAARVEDYGVFVLPRPLSRAAFFQSLKLMRAVRRRVEGLLDENRRLRDKIEELRIVERAKCVLIEHLSFTEEQAHRYIEKQAMDRRSTRRAIAEGILNTYEA